MSLKILVVPVLMIGILIISIGYVKPGVMVLLEKKSQFDAVRNQTAQLETIISNAQSLKSQVATAAEEMSFLQAYLPNQSDVEKQIDQLNFLANKSGVAVQDMQVTEIKAPPVIAEDPVVEEATSSADVLFGSGQETAALPVSVKKTYTPSTYTLTVQLAGTYDALKSFSLNIMKAKRFLKVSEASIEVVQDATASPGQPAANPDILTSKITAEFSLLPKVKTVTALGDAAFDRSQFDLSTLEAVRLSTEGAPSLPAAPTGKANLFQ